jgi:hypothetical protein
LVLYERPFGAHRKADLDLLLIAAMKKIQKPPPTEINVLLRRAEEYATSSLGGVLVGLEEDALRPNRLYRNYTQLMHGLEVHYLFPNLKRGDRKVLSDLLDARNKLVVRRQSGTRSAAIRRRVGRAGGGEEVLKRRLRELKTRAKALGRSPALTPVQREVLGQMLLPNL